MFVYTLYFNDDKHNKQVFISQFLYSINMLNNFSCNILNITEVKGMKLSRKAIIKLETLLRGI